MPRKPRFIIPGVPLHVVQRGHSKQAVFFEDQDNQVYLSYLKDASQKYDCQIHAYVLMTNHIHLLVTPSTKDSVSLMMQYTGRKYVPYINHKYGKSGTLWEGRFKASLIQEESYLLNCMRYIELNPVRAKMVTTPSHYRWSSYRCNGQGKADNLIAPHDLYQRLGRTKAARQEAYKSLFAGEIDKQELDRMTAAWMTGTPLGNTMFKEQVEKTLKQKVGQDRRGRPSKNTTEVKGL